METDVSKKLSGLFILLSTITFIGFSKGYLSLIEFQLCISSLLALRVLSSNTTVITSPLEVLYSTWNEGIYGKYKMCVASLVFLSVLVQVSVLFTPVPASVAAGTLVVAVASVALLVLLNVIAVKGTLPKIVTRQSEHE